VGRLDDRSLDEVAEGEFPRIVGGLRPLGQDPPACGWPNRLKSEMDGAAFTVCQGEDISRVESRSSGSAVSGYVFRAAGCFPPIVLAAISAHHAKLLHGWRRPKIPRGLDELLDLVSAFDRAPYRYPPCRTNSAGLPSASAGLRAAVRLGGKKPRPSC